MKKIITPVIEGSYEAIAQQVIKHNDKKNLERVNNATTDSTFTDAFEHL